MIATQETIRAGGQPNRQPEARGDRYHNKGPGCFPLQRTDVSSMPPNAEGACIRRAISAGDIDDARHFIHDMLTMLGYAPAPLTNTDDTRRDETQGSATFVARCWPDVVAAATVVTDVYEGSLPADTAFRLELNNLRRWGRLICEVSDRAVLPAYGPTNVPYDLLRGCAAHAIFVKCTDLVTVIRPWEDGKYTALGFRKIAAVQSFSSERPEPVLLVHLDLEKLAADGSTRGETRCNDQAFLKRFYICDNPYHAYMRKWQELSNVTPVRQT